jgi:hypothetical protein
VHVDIGLVEVFGAVAVVVFCDQRPQEVTPCSDDRIGLGIGKSCQLLFEVI